MDMERVKRRIRGLLNLAEDDAAADGEITAAMNLAGEMMDEHHLSRADIEAAAEPEARAADHFDTVCVPGSKKQHLTWEGWVSLAVCDLVGTVSVYNARPKVVYSGSFKRPEIKSNTVFYGPDEDARLAAELFSEWVLTIATLATGKYGGFCQGDGGKYAAGFATSLHHKAQKIMYSRCRVVTASTTALACRGNNSLAAMLERKRKASKHWLKHDRKIRLASSGSSGGYRAGSPSAFADGKADGQRAEFTAKRKAKLAGGDRRQLPG